jgi:hypothetical protein
MVRVFPRRTKWTPTDPLAFSGTEGAWPPLDLPPEQPVRVSVTFTGDVDLGLRLYRAWQPLYQDVRVGGPAFNDPGGEFVPGRFLKEGVTITSRGCVRNCDFCLVPKREGKIRELPIRDGWVVQDNNLLACSRKHIEAVFEMLRRQPKPIRLAAGLDSRLLSPWHIPLFKSIKLDRLWFSADDWKGVQSLAQACDLLTGFSREKRFCYVLIGYSNESMVEAEERLRTVWDLGFHPFAMLYQGPNGEGHKSKEWRQFQRLWCRPAAYKTLLGV